MPRKITRRLAWVRWYAEDLVHGVILLTPIEELAYRRLLDHIIIAKNMLPDDDLVLARVTRTGRQWRRIKAVLMGFGKIKVENGYIRNDRMTKEINEAVELSERQRKRAMGSTIPDVDDEPLPEQPY